MKKKKNKLSDKSKAIMGIVGAGVVLCACVVSDFVKDGFSFDFGDIGKYFDNVTKVVDAANGAGSEIEQQLGVNTDIEAWQSGSFATETQTQTQASKEPTISQTDIGTLVRVKDGDTYVLNINDVDITIRLIGVDTPESVAPASYSKENTEEGKEISAIVKEKLQVGEELTVEYDVQQKDKYGRTLAYLYLSDGTMIQDWLLENGYAQVMTIQPNCQYADHFVEIEKTAIANKIGIWQNAE